MSILKEEGAGYGLTVSGDNPVFVQAVREGLSVCLFVCVASCIVYCLICILGGPAERVGVRPGDRILMVGQLCSSLHCLSVCLSSNTSILPLLCDR